VSAKIYTVAETRWNTTQQCFASQLRMRDACKNFAQKFENVPDSKFPEACKVWAIGAFWQGLEEAELLIRPLCDASYLMQRNKGNTLAHVVLVFLVLYNHIREYCSNSREVDVMKKDLEMRWHQEDNPLFFLAFALHPSFHQMAVDILKHSEKVDGSWGRKRNALSVVRLGKAATFYYAKHKRFLDTTNRNEELLELDKCVRQWLQGKTSDLSRYKEGENAAEWWNENRTENPELAQLATFLLDCPVQGAACERLFKDFALFHTKQRNRLNPDTVYQSTLVKHMLRRKYPEDKARCASTKHTNRIVSADQYPRKNVPLSPMGHHALQQGRRRGGRNSMEMEEAEDDEEEQVFAADEEDDDDDNDDEEEDNPSLVDIVAARRRGRRTAANLLVEEEEEESCELDIWLEVLRTVVPEDDSAFYGNDDDSTDDELYGADDKEKQEDRMEIVEDSYEVAPTVLLPLPTVDNKKFAQEDKHYFKKKKYVRNDKYGLDKLLPEGMELPPLSSIYKM
jgi:hAT family C-terminal dimerisation region